MSDDRPPPPPLPPVPPTMAPSAVVSGQLAVNLLHEHIDEFLAAFNSAPDKFAFWRAYVATIAGFVDFGLGSGPAAAIFAETAAALYRRAGNTAALAQAKAEAPKATKH